MGWSSEHCQSRDLAPRSPWRSLKVLTFVIAHGFECVVAWRLQVGQNTAQHKNDGL